jgi:tetratricopeptide (TPR) repeat protein
MKRSFLLFLILAAVLATPIRAETETIDLKALAKKARPAVMLLVVSDANGKEIATGTGFLVSSDGKLITNHHVIEGGASAVAKAENGGLFPVEGILADDPKNDLVLLKFKGKDMPFLLLRKNENIEVGTRIALIGSPLGLEGTLTEGIVSAVRELMGDMRLLQITAAISPGSSGSPVLDANGEVIGVARSLLREGQALNFAVPVECANQLLAKVEPSAAPQPIAQSASSGDDIIFSDPDYRASCAAEADGDSVEQLKRNKVLVARYPDNAIAWYSLGCAFSRLKFSDDTIAAYRQAIKLRPDYARAWCNLGVAYGEVGRMDDAIAACRQATKLKPNDAETWYNLGVCYARVGRTDDAIAAYRQAIKIKPDDAETWCGLGVRFGKVGRTDDAIAAYRQAIKLKPDYARAWYNLGVVYGNAGRTDEARDAFQRAKNLNPDLFK